MLTDNQKYIVLICCFASALGGLLIWLLCGSSRIPEDQLEAGNIPLDSLGLPITASMPIFAPNPELDRIETVSVHHLRPKFTS